MKPLLHGVNAAIRRVPTWPIYLAGSFLPVWLFYLGLTGRLGPEPINALERELGELGLQALIATLLVTPLRRIAGLNLITFRRAFGLLAFYYTTCHLLVWLILDIGNPARILEGIFKRPYITIGMIGFLLMIPLALTSNSWAIRRLGPVRWRRLHMLGYVSCVLGGLHYLMIAKGWQIEPMVYLVAIMVILATRLPIVRRLVPV